MMILSNSKEIIALPADDMLNETAFMDVRAHSVPYGTYEEKAPHATRRIDHSKVGIYNRVETSSQHIEFKLTTKE